MSDFLSKFNKDKYSDLVNEQGDKDVETEQEKKIIDQGETETIQHEEEQLTDPELSEALPDHNVVSPTQPVVTRSNYRQDAEEDVEIDLDYRRKKKIKLIMIIAGSILASILLYFIYYAIVHVEVEDFVGESLSDARAWANENDVEIKVEQKYSLEYDTNRIISQSVLAGKKIKKGNTLILTSSLGPDPEEVIPLADFSVMSQSEAQQWIDDHKAENLRIVTEYSDEVEAGEFIKLTIRDSAIDASEYKRRDSAAVYYSKGEELFEKNITVPNFVGMMREEVEKWAETNEVEVTYEEADSDTIEVGSIVSQSVSADELVAKRDEIKVVVSKGKAIIVPNFWGLTQDEATMNFPDLNVTVKTVYHAEVAYGTLISQSVAADTKLTVDDDNQVTVTYSLGRPYLRDMRGQLEGDLPSLFFEEYQSKGANIKYTIKVVDSAEEKGTVVGMSKYNEFVPLNYTVEIRISNNKVVPPPPPEFEEPDPMPEPEPEPEPEQVPDEEETDIADSK